MATGISSWLNAKDFATVQAAVNAVPGTGGVVYIPEGIYDTTTTPKYTPDLLLPTDRPVHLLGAGPKATTLQGTTASGAMIAMRGDYQKVEGITLNGFGTSTGTGSGIVIGNSAGIPVRRICVVDCVVMTTSAWSIQILGTNDAAGTFAILSSLLRVECRLNQNPAFGALKIGNGNTTIYITDCSFDLYNGSGVYLTGCDGISMRNCLIEKDPPITDDSQAFLRIESVSGSCFESCWFEQHTVIQGHPFISIDGINRALTFTGGSFRRGGSTNPRIMSINSNSVGVVVVNPDIVVDDPPTGADHFTVNGAATEFVLIGGKIGTSVGSYEPKISTSLTTYGCYPHIRIASANARTMRAPSLTASQIGAIAAADKNKGDIVFNNDALVNKGQMWDGAVWRNLW